MLLPITMKKLYCAFIAIYCLLSCKENSSDVTGELLVEFSQVEDSNGRVMEFLQPRAFIISIAKANGEVIHDFEKYELIRINDQLISRPLELEIGRYVINDFMILDENDSVIYLTPHSVSDLGGLVNTPLPHGFTISANHTEKVLMEVLSSNLADASAFGYAEFSFSLIEPGIETLNKGLIAHFEFNENTNNSAQDQFHGEGNDLLLSEDRLGVSNSAYFFNGTSSYVNLGNEVGDSLRSISLWFNSSSRIDTLNTDLISLVARNNDFAGVLNSGEFSLSFSSKTFYNDQTSGRILFAVRDENGDAAAVYSENNIWNEGNWHHIVAMISLSEGLKLYVNGVLQNHDFSVNQTYNGSTTSLNRITTIGCWGDLFHRNFNGLIDNVRFYDRALVHEEVRVLYDLSL